MKNTKSKYNTLPIGVEFEPEEVEYIDAVYTQYNTLPQWVRDDLDQWLSHCIDKYWLTYNDVCYITRYAVGRKIERLVSLGVA